MLPGPRRPLRRRDAGRAKESGAGRVLAPRCDRAGTQARRDLVAEIVRAIASASAAASAHADTAASSADAACSRSAVAAVAATAAAVGPDVPCRREQAAYRGPHDRRHGLL